MQKVKKFFKRKYFLCLICALFSFLVISSTFNNNKKIVKADTVTFTGDYLYVLPQCVLGSSARSNVFMPTIFIGLDSELVPFMYTLTGDGGAGSSARDLRYVKRVGTPISVSTDNGLYSFSYNPYYLYGDYSGIIMSGQWATSNSIRVGYGFTTDISVIPQFNERSITVEEINETTTQITYSLLQVIDNVEVYSMSLIFNLSVSSSSSTFDYYCTFYPSFIPLSAFSNLGYDEGYSVGRRIGLYEGEAIGYQKGLNDSNTFTFSNLISAVIDVPINSFKSLLNFNFLDINLLDFALSIITLFVVIKIVGVINGKT